MKKEKFPTLTQSTQSPDIFEKTVPASIPEVQLETAKAEPKPREKTLPAKKPKVEASDDAFIMVTMKIRKKYARQIKLHAIETERKVYQVLDANLAKIIERLV